MSTYDLCAIIKVCFGEVLIIHVVDLSEKCWVKTILLTHPHEKWWVDRPSRLYVLAPMLISVIACR